MKRFLTLGLVLAGLTGCQTMSHVSDFSDRVLNVFSGKTPEAAVRQMEDTYFPDERREGILKLVDHDWGKQEPYTERYRQIAQLDNDYLVRATAVRALNRSRDAKSIPLFIKALDDKSEMVRLEAAKALNRVPDASAIPALLKVLGNANENKDVRIAAAEAVRHFKDLQVARTLAGQLNGRDFGVAWQARRSLREITGKDFAYDENGWLQYLTGPEKPFG